MTSCASGDFLSGFGLSDLTILFVVVMPMISILILIWEGRRHERLSRKDRSDNR